MYLNTTCIHIYEWWNGIYSLIFQTWSKGQPLDRMMESKGGCEFSFWATFSDINWGNGENGEFWWRNSFWNQRRKNTPQKMFPFGSGCCVRFPYWWSNLAIGKRNHRKDVNETCHWHPILHCWPFYVWLVGFLKSSLFFPMVPWCSLRDLRLS